MPSNGKSAADGSSFEAFAKVDELVSKPVLGSDGAASWQHFRKDHSAKIPASAAPKAPLKKTDRLAFTSWEEERSHENQVRKEAGHVEAGAGYTNFKKKNDAEEAKERKRKAQIEKRIRPDDKEYFIPAKTFEGWKFDYIFTTRVDRGGTGYYWDGNDSIKSLKGELQEETPSQSDDKDNSTTEATSGVLSDKPKKKKRKKDKASAPIFVSDPNNPIEQAQAIWQQRNQIMAAQRHSDLPSGWEVAQDSSSGKAYYFHRATGQRSWEKPALLQSSSNGEQGGDEDLPEGWKAAVDATSGNTYYYHTNGETRWTKPI